MSQNLVKMSRVPELSDPRTYVSNQGIVQLQYGVENSTVEWQQDLYDYVRESLAEGLYFNYITPASLKLSQVPKLILMSTPFSGS